MPWAGQRWELLVQERRGFCSWFWEVFGHLLLSGAAFSTFASLESTNLRGSNIPKGAAEGDHGAPTEPPSRMEVMEGRGGDSEERKVEKEGKDRERKVSVGREVLHTCGLPGWTAPCS